MCNAGRSKQKHQPNETGLVLDCRNCNRVNCNFSNSNSKINMKVKLKRTHVLAPTPFKTYQSDMGYDVTAISEEQVAPNVWKYGLGLAFQIERFDADKSLLMGIDLRPRSSVWKTGMILSNCVGTIDELYNGEVSAVFYHLIPNMPRYRVGDRIGQIMLSTSHSLQFVESSILEETERGANGYGSTNVI